MWLEVSVSKLKQADWNYKINDKDLQKKLTANIKNNGLIENLIVMELDDGFYSVVNGNHRLLSLKELKIKKAMVFNLGRISLAQAKRVATETNETRFNANPDKLFDLLEELKDSFDITDLMSTIPLDLYPSVPSAIEEEVKPKVKTLKINVTDDVLNLWNTFCNLVRDKDGHDITDCKILEYALAEAFAGDINEET